MKKIIVLLVGLAGIAYWKRKELESFFAKQSWTSPDGKGLFEQLSTSMENLYGGDLLGDGRDHSQKMDSLVSAGAVTMLEDSTSQNNGGAVINGNFADADPGTVQYLAQTECRIAVRDYGMDPALEAECRSDVVRRGTYSFRSDGVRMAVDIRDRQHFSGVSPNVVTNNDMQGSSNNWEEITEG